MSIAFLDVHYHAAGARAACVVAEAWTSERALATWVADIDAVESYEPGEFYRRELPCLLRVLSLLPQPADVLVIDGYVWLSEDGRPGLGVRLHEALAVKVPVVGVAKTAFHGAETCPIVAQVRRGLSARPLYVTAVGIDVGAAGSSVQGMAGQHRMPSLLTLTDQLSRSIANPGVPG